MPEHVDLLEQVAQELSEKAEKETNPKERKQLLDLAQRYRARAEKLRNGINMSLYWLPKSSRNPKLQFDPLRSSRLNDPRLGLPGDSMAAPCGCRQLGGIGTG